MNVVIFVAGLALSAAYPTYAAEEKKVQTKKVCVNVKDKQGKVVKDSKTGKAKQNCRVVKQHNKHKGTKVPEKK